MLTISTRMGGIVVSSDNYGLIHRHPYPDGDKYGLTMGFASDDCEPDLDGPYFVGSYDEVHQYAANEYFEYGYSEIPDENMEDNV